MTAGGAEATSAGATEAPTAGGRRAVLVGLVLLAVVGPWVARMVLPRGTHPVLRDGAAIILVVDESGSMGASDMQPDRISAVRQSIRELLSSLHPRMAVGLVAFASTVRVAAPPTADRREVELAVDSLTPSGGTAMGDALLAALHQVRPQVRLPEVGGGDVDPQAATRVPATILLLSDGANTVGTTNPLDAADIAARHGVPVRTVALGTDEGQAMIPDGHAGLRLQAVPPDRETLKVVAARTSGTFDEAPSRERLTAVLSDVAASAGYRSVRDDPARWPLAAGAVVLLLTVGLAFAWRKKLK